MDPGRDPVRTVYPGPLGGSVQHISPAAQNEVAAAALPSAGTAPAAAGSAVTAAERAASDLSPSQKPDVTGPTDSAGVDTAPTSAGAEPAASGTGVDLNTATVEELNALGAGMIGRRIVAFRPYSSPEDLVNRRVLKKSDFEVIKTAITVR
ncbi:ComEA family DNA-binding protein [Methylobacterium durans]